MNTSHPAPTPENLAGVLTGRYGRLALTRAAGEAAAAERKGDKARSALWYSVITHLRHALGPLHANGSAA